MSPPEENVKEAFAGKTHQFKKLHPAAVKTANAEKKREARKTFDRAMKWENTLPKPAPSAATEKTDSEKSVDTGLNILKIDGESRFDGSIPAMTNKAVKGIMWPFKNY